MLRDIKNNWIIAVIVGFYYSRTNRFLKMFYSYKNLQEIIVQYSKTFFCYKEKCAVL